MLEVLSLLGGGLLRLFPSLLDFFKGGRDLKYELLRMDKEAELEKLRGANRQQEIQGMAAASEQGSWATGLVEALRAEAAPKPKSGIKFLDWASASVRPVLTYWWCIGLYSSHKLIFIIVGWQEKLPLRDYAPLLLTDFDRAVVGSIIGFWFVDRALRSKS